MNGKNIETAKGFYFADQDRRLRHGDGREIVVGETHTVDGPIELCGHGLHASERLIDALYYAPGPILYRVELSGEIKYDQGMLVATHRRYLAEFDAEDALIGFADKVILGMRRSRTRTPVTWALMAVDMCATRRANMVLMQATTRRIAWNTAYKSALEDTNAELEGLIFNQAKWEK